MREHDDFLPSLGDALQKWYLRISTAQGPIQIECQRGGVVGRIQTNNNPVVVFQCKEAIGRLELVENWAAHHLVEVWASTRIHLMIGVQGERRFGSRGPKAQQLARLLTGGARIVRVAEMNRVVRLQGWDELGDFDTR